jgi:membrane associated rhomboid family serine protease
MSETLQISDNDNNNPRPKCSDILYAEGLNYLKSITDFLQPPSEQFHPVIVLPVIISVCIGIYLSIDVMCELQNCGDYYNLLYKLKWGALDVDALPQEWWRLFTYGLHHASFTHLLTNVLSAGLIGLYTEQKYGPARMLVILIGTTIGGGILAWAIKQNIIGLSGYVYALSGVYLSDLIINPETIQSKLWPIMISFAFFITIIIQAIQPNGVSVMCHLGGAISGILLSFLVLPNYLYQRWEWLIPTIGLVLGIPYFVILPVILAYT